MHGPTLVSYTPLWGTQYIMRCSECQEIVTHEQIVWSKQCRCQHCGVQWEGHTLLMPLQTFYGWKKKQRKKVKPNGSK